MNIQQETFAPWGWNQVLTISYTQMITSDPRLDEFLVARVVGKQYHHYSLVLPGQNHGEEALVQAQVSGKFSHGASEARDFPAVGDWVLVANSQGQYRIQGIIPRWSSLSRHGAGVETVEQVLAANISTLLLVFGLDGGRNFVPRLLERAMTVAWNSNAQPVVVLTKADCATEDQVQVALATAMSCAPGVPIVSLSSKTLEGIDGLKALLKPGDTVAMLGKSGAGKSALINALAHSGDHNSSSMAQMAKEGTQREGDLQGRHTTTASTLYSLGSGVLIIDSPGLRELQIWGDAEDVARAFPEIDELAKSCRFRDCTHGGEPSCAVQEALNEGSLDQGRYQSWIDLSKEQAFLERRTNQRAAMAEKAKWKAISKSMKHFSKPGRKA